MNSSILILIGAWLLVVGYALVDLGTSNYAGRSVSFKDVFFGRLSGQSSTPGQRSSQSGGPTGGSIGGILGRIGVRA